MMLLSLAGFVLLATLIEIPQESANPQSRIPLGLADGPYVHILARHHDEGIRMAQLAATNAADADVRGIGARILARQRKELAELKHFKTSVAEDFAPTDKVIVQTMPLNRLEQTTGAAFDRLFLDLMIEHHQDANTLARGAKLVMRPVQEFTRRMTQQNEIDIKEMQALRKPVQRGSRSAHDRWR